MCKVNVWGAIWHRGMTLAFCARDPGFNTRTGI